MCPCETTLRTRIQTLFQKKEEKKHVKIHRSVIPGREGEESLAAQEFNGGSRNQKTRIPPKYLPLTSNLIILNSRFSPRKIRTPPLSTRHTKFQGHWLLPTDPENMIFFNPSLPTPERIKGRRRGRRTYFPTFLSLSLPLFIYYRTQV